MNLLRQQLAAAIPERADTLWCRALLKLGETQAFGTTDAAVIVHSEAGLGVLWGSPPPAVAHEAFAACGAPAQLVASAPCALGPDWDWVPAQLLTLAGDPPPLGARAPRAKPLSPELWRGVPQALAGVLADAMERGQVSCVELEGRAVAFARAPFRSEAWFELAVDTLAPFRRRGFGRACAQALIERERGNGRAPVFAAPAADPAARALGRSLGLVDSGAPLALGRHR